MKAIAKIVVDRALNREFDYRVPACLRGVLEIGSRVRVPFGKGEATGYVVGFADASAHAGRIKEVEAVLGEKGLVTPRVLELARWMAEYYLAPVERAIRTVLPGAVRRVGARFREQLTVSLVGEGPSSSDWADLRRRAPKQARVLEILDGAGEMLMTDVCAQAGTTAAAARALERKGLVQLDKKALGRDPYATHRVLRTQPLVLMAEQKTALDQVTRAMATLTPSVVLLFGVTGSGKTEVYLQAIDHALGQDQGAIVLVPEISLTPQTVERFKARFGERVAVLHSRLSEGERHDEWHRVRAGQAPIVVGARSAVFAPVPRLGLIVVDEEHEPSYKQADSPRYHARDVAVMRGRLEGCAVLLASATPALESWWNVKKGKYGLAVLSHRVDHRTMPAVRVVDMRAAAEKSGRPNVLSGDLVEAIHDRLNKAEQTMLFLNRRGYATSLICRKCGYVAECSNCSVSLVYHRSDEALHCHLCGLRKDVPKACPECRDPAFRFSGVGTQRVESVIRKLFPHAVVQRMDSDTVRRRNAHREILGDFKAGKIDILVGTQMIAKGLHFPNVTLVGVVYADMGLHMPDFRAGERTFQLLTQVAGRAGRGEIRGEVIVQTYTPFHPAIQAARRLDFEGFCDQELEFRKELRYPPFSHLICITLSGAAEQKVVFCAETLAKRISGWADRTGTVASVPTPAPLARVKGVYRYQIFLRTTAVRTAGAALRDTLAQFKCPAGIACAADVDAVSLL